MSWKIIATLLHKNFLGKTENVNVTWICCLQVAQVNRVQPYTSIKSNNEKYAHPDER